ncbi:hypothetical protein RHGRI_011721 [Rhododendron griersonianum]|uniref:Uncharacterized protein n=1 Tax=Rhododendron griersonianum TaxID=479676 RepID=A0AAV6KP24_9ERIC|nr:hypothetical protein RHGRI_011721 [Rhododendron griersonianum]
MRQSKPVAGTCSRCWRGASVADMRTATRFCYIPDRKVRPDTFCCLHLCFSFSKFLCLHLHICIYHMYVHTVRSDIGNFERIFVYMESMMN